jgi:superfamily I DNA/RNA helicase
MAEAPDRLQRERALDPARSFIVQAPAGSGKTELLIQRYLLLLARVERPEEIVAITFTRKAAAEMRKRVSTALASARAEPRPAEAHAARTWDLARAALAANDRLQWKLEENASRLRVQTIDALCVSLTRRMPILSRMGAQPETIDDASPHYEEAARNLLEAVEIPDDDRHEDVARLLAHLDNDVDNAVELLVDMLASREHWMRVVGHANNRARLEAALAQVRIAAAKRCRELYPAAPESVEAVIALAKALVTSADRNWKKTDPLAQKLKGNDELLAAFSAMYDVPPPCYTDEQWATLDAITRILPRAVAELRLVFAARNQCDFVEVAQGAVRALRDAEGPTDLMLALDYSIRHILVDEFQDTSHAQHELLTLLTEGWEATDGRTLFVVGDPMQSIYRFRQAEVGLFLDARHAGIATVALEPLTLSANFRSQPAIVGWVNHAFRRILPPKDDIPGGAVGYTESIAMPAPMGPAIEVHPFFDKDAHGEASQVVELVNRARAENAQGSIGILVRSRSRLEQIVKALRAAGLRYRAVEIEPLAQCTVVLDLLALTHALSHLGDRIAWLSVLRAPWCGLRLEDLLKLGPHGAVWDAMNDAGTLAALSDDGRERLSRVRAILAPFVDGRMRSTLREAVESAWLALGGPGCVENATELEDATVYLDFLEANEDAGALADRVAFEQRLKKLYAVPDLQADERLQVMTMHKAKGLEFDTVILPGLGGGTEPDRSKLFAWTRRRESAHAEASLLVAPINATGSDDEAIYKYIRRVDRAHGEHETGRLLYVATTRARTRLHVCGDVVRNRAGEFGPRKGSLLAQLWPVVQERFVPPEGDAPAPRASHGPRAAQPLRRVALPLPPLAVPPSARWNAPPEEARLRDIEFSWAGETARRIGTVTHAWLQRISQEGLEHWNREKVDSLKKVFRANLAAAGVGDVELKRQRRRWKKRSSIPSKTSAAAGFSGRIPNRIRNIACPPRSPGCGAPSSSIVASWMPRARAGSSTTRRAATKAQASKRSSTRSASATASSSPDTRSSSRVPRGRPSTSRSCPAGGNAGSISGAAPRGQDPTSHGSRFPRLPRRHRRPRGIRRGLPAVRHASTAAARQRRRRARKLRPGGIRPEGQDGRLPWEILVGPPRLRAEVGRGSAQGTWPARARAREGRLAGRDPRRPFESALRHAALYEGRQGGLHQGRGLRAGGGHDGRARHADDEDRARTAAARRDERWERMRTSPSSSAFPARSSRRLPRWTRGCWCTCPKTRSP